MKYSRRHRPSPEELKQLRRAKQRKIASRKRARRVLLIKGGFALLGVILFIFLLISGISRLLHGKTKTAAGSRSFSTEAVAATEVPETVPAERTADSENEISLLMVGDILLHQTIHDLCKLENGSYNYSRLFDQVTDYIRLADVAIANQEIMIGGSELGVSGYPSFNAPYDLADNLADAGFDVILHATNHANDKGSKAIRNCLKYWEKEYPEIAVLGIHEDKEDAEEIYVYEKAGIKVAILNYTELMNKAVDKSKASYLVDRLDKKKVKADLEKARELADFVVVCPHWGTEYSLTINKSQEEWTAFFLEQGVDLVIGTHPHVIEPIEMLEDPETGHQMLVYYSLGNYVSWISEKSTDADRRVIGGMAKVTVGKDASGQAVIVDYGIEPLVCQISNEEGCITYPYNLYSDELASTNLVNTYGGELSMNSISRLCDEIWPDTKRIYQ